MRGKAGEITRIILKGILITGAVAVASTSPVFVSRILPEIGKYIAKRKNKKEMEKKLYNSFYYLKKQGMLNMEYRGEQLHISLTEEGRKKAGSFQIDDLKIKRPKKWDKKWRILIFDIKDKQKIKREALRGKIKELGLFQLQKSVWICPYDFVKGIEFLRNFFALNKAEMNTIIACEIENDQEARRFFRI